MKLKTEVEITDEQLHGVFTTALETYYGIGYWSRTRSYHWHLPLAEGQKFGQDDLLGFYAEIEESDEGDRPLIINRQTIVQGLQRLADGTVTHGGEPWGRANALVSRIVCDDYDSSDADIVVQAGLFGDVKYG